MHFSDLFFEELNTPETRYFIFDTKGAHPQHGDADFIKYLWQTNKFNLVRTGDLFLYRRPGKASETKKFYFFGAGKVGTITALSPTEKKRVEGQIVSPYPFKNHLHPSDLEDFAWHFKTRQPGSWEHFFNQYGMNQITKMDFIELLQLSDDQTESEYDNLAATNALQAIQKHDYYVEDEKSETKRRAKQNVFANTVKNNYQNRCALCGIQTRSLLIGSHIIPWSVNKQYRLDPANGISLCVLHDKLFDTGLITLDENLKVTLSPLISNDPVLAELTHPINGKKLKLPKVAPPKKEYLRYHRTKIFKS